MLKGIYLLERDNANNVFTWAFPRVCESTAAVLKQRSGLTAITQDIKTTMNQLQTTTRFVEKDTIIHRYENKWCYTYNVSLGVSKDDMRDENGDIVLTFTHVSLTVLADHYNLPLYHALLQLLATIYLQQDIKTPKPPTHALLQYYLEANANGKIVYTPPSGKGDEILTFDSASFDPRAAMIQPTHLILEYFGQEAILIYLAVLLKKRIIVYHPDPLMVSTFVRILPTFGAWHRNNIKEQTTLLTFLQPYNTELTAPGEVENLTTNAGSHINAITGITTQTTNLELHDNLWDVYIDAYNKNVDVKASEKKSMSLIKFHKAIIDSFLAAYTSLIDAGVNNDNNELAQGIIKTVMIKTKEILGILDKCKNDQGIVSIETIRTAGIPTNLEQFIYNIAIAENCVERL